MNLRKTTGCTFAACALAAALGACGGGFDDEDAALLFDIATLATPTAQPASEPPPLLGDDGLPSAPLPQAVPHRGDELTRAGLYALRAQARALERALRDDVVWVNQTCCSGDGGATDAELAIGIVAALMAVRDLDANAPVFVDLSDRRQGAALADQLSAAGYTRVFLVTD
jgi:hypothetical protein